ncbi:MAG: 50S ribosomal protein L15 [Candidatus Taylorbacteria bacterium RIFCSPHIGHO2_01_FULL_46_22b]|uniref:Large ribosomal subunit protein uL15 n=1 Tax=Candidatus Taylorbacteria bacterium RIFCSPHIGHO2_01_FULL_46_22b TaxID=1802301 RepID=A0A1G2M528_9BACT|nr:MAG: 50S ribosomal protein L15 [Candidatus Taylorbacteria bacterium RIFCSPHIGHO2_01_FULL_46_22b]
MQVHNVKRNTKRKYSQSVGRGGKRGKTSGRGTKGQKARSGRKIRPEIRDVIMRIPKLRGHGKNSNFSIQTKPTMVNLSSIEKHFSAGDTINPTTLVEKGLVNLIEGKLPVVKILADGDLGKKVMVEGCRISVSAKAKIEKAGGAVKN